MIPANEIRVGIYVSREKQSPRGLDYDTMFQIDAEAMGQLFGPDTDLALQDLFPIPITTKLATEKLGFKYYLDYDTTETPPRPVHTWHLNIDRIQLSFIEGLVLLNMRHEKSPQQVIVHRRIRNLHELQNLVLDFFGKELEIKIHNNG